MITVENISKYKLPAPYSKYAADINDAIKSKLYSKDADVRNMIDGFITKVNLEISKKTKTAYPAANTVKTFKLEDIKLDPSRFQNRSKLDQAILNDIVKNYNATAFDPLVIWQDPADENYYLLAGHHRYAALKKLNIKNAPVKIANADYPTEKAAIRYAREESNANRSLETPIERAKIYRDKIAAGASKKELDAAAAKEGKNRSYILNLAHLNPKGAVIENLERFSDATDKESSNQIEKQADWIGAARRQFSKLTNAHESEMFTFLNDPASSKRVSTKATFLQYVNSIAGGFDFDESKPLNLKRFKYKSQGEQQYDDQVSNVKDEIQDAQSKIDAINARFYDVKRSDYIEPDAKDYDQVRTVANNRIAQLNGTISNLQSKLAAIYSAKGNYINAGSNQLGMFGGMGNPTLETPSQEMIITDLPADANQDQLIIDVIDTAQELYGNDTTKGVIQVGKKVAAAARAKQLASRLSGNGNKNSKVRSLSDKAQRAPDFPVNGATGEFLGRLERKPKESIVITVDAGAGAGKTTAFHKWFNDFASAGHRILFASMEQHPDSNLAQDMVDDYIDPENLPLIDVVDEIRNQKELDNLVPNYDVIFVDSFGKMRALFGQLKIDENLRKRYDGKVFVLIFQRTTDGKMRGGADGEFDGDIIVKGEKGESFDENYFYHYKNRYAVGDISKQAYNVAGHFVYDPTDPDAETKTETQPQNLSTVFM